MLARSTEHVRQPTALASGKSRYLVAGVTAATGGAGVPAMSASRVRIVGRVSGSWEVVPQCTIIGWSVGLLPDALARVEAGVRPLRGLCNRSGLRKAASTRRRARRDRDECAVTYGVKITKGASGCAGGDLAAPRTAIEITNAASPTEQLTNTTKSPALHLGANGRLDDALRAEPLVSPYPVISPEPARTWGSDCEFR